MHWTNQRSLARVNEYEGGCRQCLQPVIPHAGYLVATEVGGRPMTNGSIHKDCGLPSGYYFRIQFSKRSQAMDIALVKNAPDIEFSAQDILKELTQELKAEEAEPAREPTEQELQRAVEELLKKTTDSFLEAVPPLVRATLLELTRTVEIKVGSAPKVKVENSHKALPDIVMCVAAGTNPFLVGPAGSGKTTLAEQVAKVLKRKFYAENRVTSEYKLLGYMDATGKYVRTQFREAYEHGGGFLLDEVDASDPDVLTTFNSALANGICPFPDKMVKAHKDFFAIAAGNTYGRGADRQYVGRNQLDAATLDRFVVIEIDYDEQAELSWAADDDWTMYVQSVRKAIDQEKVRHIVSPRASIYGARLLAAGMERKLVEERCIWKGLDNTNKARVLTRMGAL